MHCEVHFETVLTNANLIGSSNMNAVYKHVLRTEQDPIPFVAVVKRHNKTTHLYKRSVRFIIYIKLIFLHFPAARSLTATIKFAGDK